MMLQDMMLSYQEYPIILQLFQMLKQVQFKLEIQLQQLDLDKQSQQPNLDYHNKG
jgi:hypothetical protein